MGIFDHFDFWRERRLRDRLSPLQQQIDSLKDHIKADLAMKNQQEEDFRNAESARLKASLEKSIKESKRNLIRHEEELEDLFATQEEIIKKYAPSSSRKVVDIRRTEGKGFESRKEEIGNPPWFYISSFYREKEKEIELLCIFFSVAISVVLFFSLVPLLTLKAEAFVSDWRASDIEKCSRSLEGKIKQQIESIEDACSRTIENASENGRYEFNARKNRGRARLVLFNPDNDRLQKLQRVKDVSHDFEESKDALQQSNSRIHNSPQDAERLSVQRPRIQFYNDFMKDFDFQVGEPIRSEVKEGPCKQIYSDENEQGLYDESINLYLKKANFTARKEDFFILVELAHFLINRDGRYNLAAQLLDKIPEELLQEDVLALSERGLNEKEIREAKEEYSKQYRQNVMFTRAVSHALAETVNDSELAGDGLDTAASILESILSDDDDRESRNELGLKFNYFLANMYFEQAYQVRSKKGSSVRLLSSSERALKFEKAAELYKAIVKTGGGAEKFYKARRNLGLSLYLQALYSDEGAMAGEDGSLNNIDADGISSLYEDALNNISMALYDFEDVRDIDSDKIRLKENANLPSIQFIPDIESKSIFEVLHDIKNELNSCIKADRCSLTSEALTDVSEVIRKVVSGSSYYIIHEGVADPFFAVEHDKFYCFSKASGGNNGQS